jgi:hypothetical protein
MDGAHKPKQEIVEAKGADQAQTSLMSIVAMAVKDPAVTPDKLQGLIDVMERLERRDAEKEFNQALANLATKMPRIKKNGKIELPKKDGTTGVVSFAKIEHIDTAIRPLLTEAGFSLSFDTAQRQSDGGGLIITGILLHKNGYSRTSSMPLPLDSGPGRNNLQANGSTMSYGRRYVTCMLLNIITEGEDDDGTALNTITIEEAAEVDVKVTETNSDKKAFLEYMGVDDVRNILAKDKNKALSALKKKAKAKANAA